MNTPHPRRAAAAAKPRSACQLLHSPRPAANPLDRSLAINAALFIGEYAAGWWAGSTALQADSLDNVGDAGVYALSLFVVGRSMRWRAGAGVVKGGIQGLFGLAVLAEVGRKALLGATPEAPIMVVAASIALGGQHGLLLLAHALP